MSSSPQNTVPTDPDLLVPIRSSTLREMAARVAAADQASKRAREAAAAYLRGCADRLESGGAT